MPIYKAFWVDTRTNLVRSETIEATDDDQARAFANQSNREARQEIWDGERFVGSVEPNQRQNWVVAAKRRRN